MKDIEEKKSKERKTREFFYKKGSERDIKIVLKVLLIHGQALEFVGEDLKDNKDVVMTAVKSNPLSLYYASKRMKDDYDVVKVGIKSDTWNCFCFKDASSRLRDNKELALLAIERNANMYYYVSDRLKEDEEVVIKALCNGYDFKKILTKFRDDEFAIYKFLKETPESFRDVSGNFICYPHEGIIKCLSPRIKELVGDFSDVNKVKDVLKAIVEKKEMNDKLPEQKTKKIMKI